MIGCGISKSTNIKVISNLFFLNNIGLIKIMNKNYIEWGHYRGQRKKKNFSIYGKDAYDLWNLGVRFK